MLIVSLGEGKGNEFQRRELDPGRAVQGDGLRAHALSPKRRDLLCVRSAGCTH